MNCRSDEFDAFEFAENCKQLKFLEVPYQYVPKGLDWRRFESLERIHLGPRSLDEELTRAIEGLPKLTKFKAQIDFNFDSSNTDVGFGVWFPLLQSTNLFEKLTSNLMVLSVAVNKDFSRGLKKPER